jgi:hypothetical protein
VIVQSPSVNTVIVFIMSSNFKLKEIVLVILVGTGDNVTKLFDEDRRQSCKVLWRLPTKIM